MDLTEIEIRLKERNYFTLIRNNIIIGGTNLEPVDDIISVYQNRFEITIDQDILILEYLDSQISINKTFTSLDNLISFITQKFPT